MKVLEYESKALLRLHQLPIPEGEVARSKEAALLIANQIGYPVAIKAQIPVSGRMKMGGVRFASSPDKLGKICEEILGNQMGGFYVERVLIEQKLETKEEIYLAITYDTTESSAALLASRGSAEAINEITGFVRKPFSTISLIPDHVGRQIAWELGFNGIRLLRLGATITELMRVFISWDALLLEINPVIIDRDGLIWLADVHLELDDDAQFRQATIISQLVESNKFASPLSDFERRAIEIDSQDHRGVAGRLIAFDGELGLLIGGGGASLTIFDAVLEGGLKPANYCEIGGNPSVWKVKELTKLLLAQPTVKHIAVIMNVVSNTRVDLIARGVIKGVVELGMEPKDVIIAFRVPGSWESEGKKILDYYEIPYFGRDFSLDRVVEAIKWRF